MCDCTFGLPVLGVLGFLGMIITWDSLWEFVLRIERSLRLRRVFFKAEAKEKKMEQVKGAFDLDGKTLNFGGGQLIVEDEQNKVMIGGGMVIVEQLDIGQGEQGEG